MGLNQVSGLRQYADLLRDNSAEASALANDLMINVTGFFRDPEAWEQLRMAVVAPLVAAKREGEPLRCWVTACASGEEAYTLAILIAEEARLCGGVLRM
jgi:chemotaxis methyl-accepting protein methylase